MAFEPIKTRKNANELIKTQGNTTKTTRTTNQKKLPNKNTKQTSSTDSKDKKHQRHVLEYVLEWKWMKKMKRTRKLMWLELFEMCTPLEG